MSAQPLLALTGWVPVLDGHPAGVRLYEGHYSARKSLATRLARGSQQFGGSGERMVLLTADESALFVWRRQNFRLDSQRGVECSVFRNTGPELSSELILGAEALAWGRWPGARFFTFIDADATSGRRSRRAAPGHCFRVAGWTECGRSSRGLIVLEKLPPAVRAAA